MAIFMSRLKGVLNRGHHAIDLSGLDFGVFALGRAVTQKYEKEVQS